MNADWSKVNAGIGKKENRPPEFTHLTSTDLAEVRFLRHQGWSMVRIAKRLGRSTATIHRALEWEREDRRQRQEQAAIARNLERLRAEEQALLATMDSERRGLQAAQAERQRLQEECEAARRQVASLASEVAALAQHRGNLQGAATSLESRRGDLAKAVAGLEQLAHVKGQEVAQHFRSELTQAGWIPPDTVDAGTLVAGYVAKGLWNAITKKT